VHQNVNKEKKFKDGGHKMQDRSMFDHKNQNPAKESRHPEMTASFQEVELDGCCGSIHGLNTPGELQLHCGCKLPVAGCFSVRIKLSVLHAVRKTSPLDVLPCSLLKNCADVFTPVITRLANMSLQAGTFPARYKFAQVLPLLKKAGLNRSSPINYRPISNLSTVSKVLERLVQARLRPHLMSSTNFSQFQSAYRQGHCTETALLDVLDTVYTAADKKQVTVLIGLDLSAAFDTVSH